MMRNRIFLTILFFCIGGALFWGVFLMWKKISPFTQRNRIPSSPVVFLACEQSAIDLFGTAFKKEKTALSSALLDRATRDIFKVHREYLQAPTSDNAVKLQELAAWRKSLFIEVMHYNPDAALFSLLAANERDVMNTLTHGCIESPTTQEGILEINHTDFLDGSGQNQYIIVTSSGKRIILHSAFRPHINLISGARVRVEGFLIDDHLIFDGDSEGSLKVLKYKSARFWGDSAHAAISASLGVQKTIVLLVNFQNTVQPNLTHTEVQDIIFNKVNSYYLETSYNKTSFSGDVFGWYAIPIDQTCSFPSVRYYAMNNVPTGLAIDFTKYSRVIIIAPFGPSCSYGGTSSIGKQVLASKDGAVEVASAGIVASYVTPNNGESFMLFAHELGHELGVDHASFLDCGSASITSQDCAKVEYGNPYSIMGVTTSAGHMDAVHKYLIGWLDASNILTADADGSYVIEPIEINSPGAKVLKIPRGPNNSNSFFVEYRQPIGFDAQFPISNSNVFSGALLYSSSGGVRSMLIDAISPADSNNAALPLGAVFTDPLTGITLQTTALSPTALTIKANLAGNDFTSPNVSITSPVNNTTVSGIITVKADAFDSSGIQKVEFLKGGMIMSTDVTAPYEMIFNTINEPNGKSYWRALAYDIAGNAAYSSLLTITIVNNNDIVPPDAAVIAPLSGVTVNNPVVLEAAVTDNVGVQSVEFYKDGENIPFYIASQTPYIISNSENLFTQGSHTVFVKAYDLSGNVGVSTIILFTVLNSDTTSPAVSFIAPMPNAVVGGTITVSVDASDDIGVTKVEFYKDADMAPYATLSAFPFTANLNTATLAFGAHTLKVKAYDAAGNAGSSILVSITIDNVPPVISLTAPGDASVVSGAAVAVSVSASDNVAVQHVDFYRDTDILIGTDTSSPYSIAWDSTTVSNGAHTLFARAHDIANNQAITLARAITVNNTVAPPPPPSTTSLPTVIITAPLGGAALKGMVSVGVALPPNMQVERIEFYQDNDATPFTTIINSPFQAQWDTTKMTNGNHAVRVRTYFTDGKIITSAGLMVSIQN